MTSAGIFSQQRNQQLDFFRGAALLTIFVNHLPGNPWFWYTPSRFGLSDAAEVFVFLSGFTSALAFGRSFERVGLWLGSVRVLYRCWQIYAAHLASFLLLAAICVTANRCLSGVDYIQALNIAYFFDTTQQAVFELFSLRYVPNYFDILPMYLVMLLWLPLVWSLSRLHVALALAFPFLIYLAAGHYGWELTADSAGGRPWYFNPFHWQLMFFTGLALGAGWLPRPALSGWLLALCVTFVILAVPLGHEATYRQSAFWGHWRGQLEPWLDKRHLGLLRWLHLLAMAYLMNGVLHWKPHWLSSGLPRLIVTMGQQSLPMFVFSMVLSFAGGIALDSIGRDAVSTALVNLAGLGLLLTAGQLLAWLSGKPWQASADTIDRATDAQRDFNLTHAFAWSRQALLASLLLSLAALPMLSIQQPTVVVGTVPDQVVDIQPDDEGLRPVNAVLPETSAEDLDEQQQHL